MPTAAEVRPVVHVHVRAGLLAGPRVQWPFPAGGPRSGSGLGASVRRLPLPFSRDVRPDPTRAAKSPPGGGGASAPRFDTRPRQPVARPHKDSSNPRARPLGAEHCGDHLTARMAGRGLDDRIPPKGRADVVDASTAGNRAEIRDFLAIRQVKLTPDQVSGCPPLVVGGCPGLPGATPWSPREGRRARPGEAGVVHR